MPTSCIHRCIVVLLVALISCPLAAQEATGNISGTVVDASGAAVPNVDGILFEAGRLWAVQNFSNQVTEFRLSPDLSSASVLRVITSPAFEIPTTAARDGNRLAIVNAKFDTGFPPTATSYEVVVVDGR